ncbi:hypothetical protein NDI49_10030 [Trichocoleus sp. ST-U3]|nr:hypothetical protein [Coleofasciculus sp. FACHB-542]
MATVLIAIFCVFWVSFRLPEPSFLLVDPDGGHQLAGANQILFGEHPFIHFRSTYGPLVFYASALSQILSGKRIIGEMILLVVGYSIAYVLLFRLLWLASGRLSISIVFTLLGLTLIPRIYKYYIVLGPVMSLFAAWSYVERPSRRSLWFLALEIAITGLFRPDFGVYSALCGIVVVGLRPTPKLLVKIQRLSVFVGAIIVCASPWLIWSLLNGGLGNYFYDSTFGAVNHAVGLSLPLPGFKGDGSLISPENAVFVVSRFFYALPVVSIFVAILRRNQMTEEERRKILATAILAQAALLQASHRADYGHLLQAIPVSFVLCAWLTGVAISLLQSGSFWQRRYAVAGLGTLVGIAATFIFITTSLSMWPRFDLYSLQDNLRIYSGSTQTFLNYVEQKDPDNWHIKAIRYTQRCTSSSQRILALPFLTSLYYLADRPFGGGQMLLAPGYFSTKNDQVRMVKRMSDEKVSLVIDIKDFVYDNREDRKVKKYASLVFDYLEKNFIEVKKIDPAVVKVNREQIPVLSTNRAIEVSCPIEYSKDRI